MEYKFKINEFEGPLDLLLHLIKESNVDIYDIKVEEVTRQYLEYIKAMEKLNLSIASEYLVMAAELIEMKSRSLLPNYKEEKDGFEEDPREMLIKKLIDYKQYKEITSKFREWESARQLIYTKLPADVKEYVDTSLKNNGETTIDDLLNAFQNFWARKAYQKPLKTRIAMKEISLNERVISIRGILKGKSIVTFEELFDIYNKEYVVVTFLSILEMAKSQEIIIKQNDNFDKIYIELRGCE